MGIEVVPVKITDEVGPNTDIVDLIKKHTVLQDGDIVVISQKIISKHEQQMIDLSKVIPSLLSVGIASEYGKDPRLVEVILSESKRIVRLDDGIIIVETHHGFICANAGVDESNVPSGFVTLLPKDPDFTAEKIMLSIKERLHKSVAVLISDTFGRPFRMGQTDVAIGSAGLNPILDYAGKKDPFGRTLRVSALAIADEICSSAELVKGKLNNCPIVVIKNFQYDSSTNPASSLIRPKNQDLFI